MWTGFWKLTVMVGVVGVGLFAVFQSQKGRDFKFPGSFAAVANSPANAGEEPAPDEAPKPSASDRLSELPPVSLKPSPKSKGDIQNGQLDEPSERLPAKSKFRRSDTEEVVGSRPSLILPVNRRATSRSEDTFEDDQAAASDDKAVTLANDSVAEELPDDAKKLPASEVEIEEVDAKLEGAELQPEPEPQTESLVKTDAESDEPSPEASEAPQFGDTTEAALTVGKEELESPPPRSKRARRNTEPLQDSIDSSEKTETAETAEETPVTETPVEVTEKPDEPRATENLEREPLTDDQPERTRELPVSKRPREILKDTSDDRSESPESDRRPTSRKGKSNPARIPIDLDDEPSGRTSDRNRDPQLQRAGRELESADILGDGVAGDASQSGMQQPRITIEKVAQQQAILGQPLIYSILIKNVGTVDAHNLVIEDRIPKGTKLEGTSPQAELSGKRLVWNHERLRPNEEKKISIKVIPQQEGLIGSVARVHFATEVSTEIIVAAPQLDLTVKAPREVRVGQRFELVYSLKNVGTVDANEIILRDVLPPELVHDKGDDIECPIGRLAPNEAREIVLSVLAERTGSVMNNAKLYLDKEEKKSLDTPIDVIGEVLVLTRDGQDRVYVERPVTFKNNIRNDGNQRADRIKLAETVPPGMEFSTASDGGRFDPNLRSVVWSIGPLAPGSDKTVSVKYVPQKTGTFDAKITATGSAGSSAAVKSTVDVVGKPELLMETLSATGSVTLGDRITSRFQLKNTGTAAANDVQLKIRLPRQLRLSSVKGGKFQQNNDILTFESIDEFEPKSTAAYELILEATDEGDAQITLDIYARHLTKPGHRVEIIQIARDTLK